MNKETKKGQSMKNETKKHTTNGRTDGKHESKRIHFEFASPTAGSVAIAGSFNEWHPSATPMIALGQGRWIKELVLPPGVYEYRLVVDGDWMPDPRASEIAPNPFGEMNSVLKVNGCVR
jgi:Carbohydrate-binding module 48 (Isoamylase N-terminal domain).